MKKKSETSEKSSKKTTLASHLGSALAHVQDGVDQVVAFGFKKLKDSGRTKVKKSDSTFKKTMVKTADFLGETGSTFFEKYEGIKEKRRKK